MTKFKVGDLVHHRLGLIVLLVYQYGLDKDITYVARYKLKNEEIKDIKVKPFEISRKCNVDDM